MNVKPDTALAYRDHLAKVLEYIHDHLNEDLLLEDLAAVAGFSPYHFHRIFKGFVGVSVAQYVRQLRMAEAVRRLRDGSQSITEIALEAGYQTPSAFTKAFKKLLGVSPSACDGVMPLPHLTSHEGKPSMKPEIRDLAAREVIYVRRRGMIGGTFTVTARKAFDVLSDFTKAEGIEDRIISCLAINPDDPDSMPPEDCRYDACFELREDTDYTLRGDVEKQVIEQGRFAVFEHRGPYDTLWQTWNAIYRDWLPKSGMTLRDAPPYEVYVDDPNTTSPQELKTEIHIPIK